MHPDVKAYIENADPERRKVLEELHAMITEALPQAEESLYERGNFPVYTVGGEWKAGFANRKQGPMLYIMETEIIDRYADTFGNLRTGKSCVMYKGNKSIEFEEVRKLGKKMLTELSKSVKKQTSKK